MKFDEILKTWRAQDEKPLYGVNRDLLQLVLQHEQADLRRKLRLEHWMVYVTSTVMLCFAGFFLLAFLFLRGTVWDVVAASVGVCATVAGAGSLWLSRRRQAQRERAFGNSLREEIGRNLSLLDYQLSRTGQTARALLIGAPFMLTGLVVYWQGTHKINHHPVGWFDAWYILFMLVLWVVSVIWSSRNTKKKLLPRRHRLSELLELLNSSE